MFVYNQKVLLLFEISLVSLEGVLVHVRHNYQLRFITEINRIDNSLLRIWNSLSAFFH